MHWANKYRAWALAAVAGAELNIKKAKVPPRLRMPHQTERMILKSPLTFPKQQKYKAANETLEGIEMSVDAIGLDARDRLIEDEDYEPELLRVTKSDCLTMRSIRSLVHCLMKVRSH